MEAIHNQGEKGQTVFLLEDFKTFITPTTVVLRYHESWKNEHHIYFLQG